MNYKIISKYQKDGRWHVTYKTWPKGECFCMAETKKITLGKEPTVAIIQEAEN